MQNEQQKFERSFAHFSAVVHNFARFIHVLSKGSSIWHSEDFVYLFLKTSHVIEALWTMWKTYPPQLWKNSTSQLVVWMMWKSYPPALWISKQCIPCLRWMWKTYQQLLWICACLAVSSVDDVEKLSTGFVEKLAAGHAFVDDVEKLSTGFVENATSSSSLKNR